jgi:hypothetical protein
LFQRLWQAGLMEYDEMQGIAWTWQSIDGALSKAPLAQEAVGPNPTDRGKKREQAQPAGGRAWHPRVACRERRRDAGCVVAPGDVAGSAFAASPGPVADPAISERGQRVYRRNGLERQPAAGLYARLATTWPNDRSRPLACGSPPPMGC